MEKIRIATRTSKLALTQAKMVEQELCIHYPKLSTEIVGFKTAGDKILDKTLAKIGGKGLFVKELEESLLSFKADIAVHSMKDVPAILPESLKILAVLPRASAADVLLSKEGKDLLSLPKGSIVGTSSLRRQAQILKIRPDLVIKPLRGNIDTRVKKLLDGDFTGIVLAQAAVDRLNINIPGVVFAEEEMLPAVGQGIIGVEAKDKFLSICNKLNDINTWHCLQAERSMNKKLNGSCSTPIGGYAKYIESNKIMLTGLVASPDGSECIYAQKIGLAEDAHDIGEEVADELLIKGATKLLKG